MTRTKAHQLLNYIRSTSYVTRIVTMEILGFQYSTCLFFNPVRFSPYFFSAICSSGVIPSILPKCCPSANHSNLIQIQKMHFKRILFTQTQQILALQTDDGSTFFCNQSCIIQPVATVSIQTVIDSYLSKSPEQKFELCRQLELNRLLKHCWINLKQRRGIGEDLRSLSLMLHAIIVQLL